MTASQTEPKLKIHPGLSKSPLNLGKMLHKKSNSTKSKKVRIVKAAPPADLLTSQNIKNALYQNYSTGPSSPENAGATPVPGSAQSKASPVAGAQQTTIQIK